MIRLSGYIDFIILFTPNCLMVIPFLVSLQSMEITQCPLQCSI